MRSNPGSRPPSSHTPTVGWRLLLRWRWVLAGAIGVAFAAGRLLEAALLDQPLARPGILIDSLLWASLGGLAVWASLTWAMRQEQRHESELEASLLQQSGLNERLTRANRHLELLSSIGHRLAVSSSLDAVLDAALEFPQQVVTSEAAALWLHDPVGDLLARVDGSGEGEIEARRATLGNPPPPEPPAQRPVSPSGADTLLQLPLWDRRVRVGWIELFLAAPPALEADERELLTTISHEIGEAIGSARRRAREARTIVALEQAIIEERARIARDIHDGLAQTLAFQRMRVDLWLDWIEEEPERLREELIGLKGQLRAQIAELRRAVFALRPIQFDEYGFAGGLHRYITEFAQQMQWQIEVDLAALPPHLPVRLEATCFRVVQEALTNSAKHADADHVSVRVEVVEKGLELVVRDDGRGFDLARLDGAPDRVGLRQMRERLLALDGQLAIRSEPDAGTELRIRIPLEPFETSEPRAAGPP